MASQSLISTVDSYENYIEKNGIDEQVIDAYIQAVEVALRTEPYSAISKGDTSTVLSPSAVCHVLCICPVSVASTIAVQPSVVSLIS